MDESAKNVAYSTAQALNETAKQAQREEREHVHKVFTVRNPQFIDRLIKIGAFASVAQNRPYVDVYVDQRPLKSQVLLPTFEEGGVKLPRFGQNIAVPITGGPARPVFSDTIPQEMRIPALRFRQVKTGRKPADAAHRHTVNSGVVWKGRLGTYLIPNVGIFQRQGDRSVLIYTFKKSVRLDSRLAFGKTISEVFARVYADNFDGIFLLKGKSLR